ncbi:MAG: hypothetical protein L0Y36_05720 [Planctomycetales bacterium]|nr:hypothetical protein [Planctomycetales bacterium]
MKHITKSTVAFTFCAGILVWAAGCDAPETKQTQTAIVAATTARQMKQLKTFGTMGKELCILTPTKKPSCFAMTAAAV